MPLIGKIVSMFISFNSYVGHDAQPLHFKTHVIEKV